MTQSVSARLIGPIASAVTMSVLWIALAPPVMGTVPGGLLGLLTLATAAMVAMRMRSTGPVPVTVVVPTKPVV